MQFPVQPTIFNNTDWDPSIEYTDTFHCKAGFRDYPDHHCKTSWEPTKPYVKNFRTAIDIGCRDGEFSRYLTNSGFKNVYCFDVRTRKFFPKNVDPKKVTHFGVALGNGEDTVRIRNEKPIKGKGILNGGFWKLDDFNFVDVDFIKMDTDGFERSIIEGGLKTITTYWPVINLEVFFETDTLKYMTDELGYKVMGTCPRGYDYILVKE
jgi:hypothetical protein